ncbi:MAG TPA: beta-N-acetylglucosaminidase domain-containing protein [Acidimicrobiales bacterium]|nr:beta-N-acetylglucosaminidase domain-containing protein [Acidimicrobiales bacterium]
MTIGPTGVIEGFYGPPWSWAARTDVAAWCAARGMADYVYAPKDDPKHRDQWREPYDDEELAGFEAFARDGALALGFAVSPGLSIDPDDDGDLSALATKVDQVVGVGAASVVLALDDIPFGGGPQGAAHARLTTRLRDHLGERATLSLVPTEYVGLAPSPYLDELARGVPEDVPIAWTGRAVVNDAITAADARARAAALGGRPPLVWDNYPVNDGIMADRLFLGPLRGRDRGLLDECAGYLANPMVQPMASRLPLASVAAWLRGEDPTGVWSETAADLGWLAFAHACDGVAAAEVVAGGDLRAIRAHFADAAVCAAPGLEAEADPWLDQAHLDATLALGAVDLLEGERSVAEVLGVLLRWQASRRTRVTVFGPRCSVRPVLGQAQDGTWTVDAASIEADRNAVDALVRRAVASL